MHRTTKRLASALLAAVLCAAAALPAGADYEPWTYEVDSVMGGYGVEYYSDVGFENPTGKQSTTTAQPSTGGVSTYSSAQTSRAVALDGAESGTETVVIVTGEQTEESTAVPTKNDISVYSAGDFNVYSAGDDGQYFTVTIPAEVKVNTDTEKGKLSISSELTKCSNLVITIASQSATEENKYYLTCGTEKLEYKMAHDAIVFSKDNDNENTVKQSQDIDIRVLDTPTVSGTYEDILTFEITPREYTTDASKHTLTFNLNTNTDTAIPDDVITISTESKVITSGEEYGTLPTPRRDGFEFAGWCTAAGVPVSASTVAGDADAIVYAQWTPHKLTIKYHNDGAERISWEANPATDKDGAYLNKDTDLQEYELIYNDKKAITGLKLNKLSDGDVTLVEIESYGKNWTNGQNGIFDVYRWKIGNYTGSGTTWALYEGGPGVLTEFYDLHYNSGKVEYCTSAQAFAAYADDVANLGLLQSLKDGDVTLDLYPVWPAGAKTSEIDEITDDDTVTLLPEVDKTKPVVIDMPTIDLDDAADAKADTKKDTAADTTGSTAKADTKADDTTTTGSGTKTDTKADETTADAADEKTTTDTTTKKAAADTTPDDLMIWDADTMPALVVDDYDANELAVVW